MGKFTVAAALVLAGSVNAYAQDNNVKFVGEAAAIHENTDRSFVRPNIFYKITGIDGYTFVEFYGDENYFGKNMLTKKIGKGFSAMSEIVVGSQTDNRISLGVKYSPPMPKGSTLSFKALPLWFDAKGREDRFIAGISGSVDLPWRFDFSGAFFEFNVRSHEVGYGELPIGVRLSEKLGIYYNMLLKKRKEGSMVPRAEHAAMLRYDF